MTEVRSKGFLKSPLTKPLADSSSEPLGMSDEALEQDINEFIAKAFGSSDASLTDEQISSVVSGENELGYNDEVLGMLITHFSDLNNALQGDSKLELGLQSSKQSLNISEAKAELLAKSTNPYTRIEIAKKGLCPHVLKHDPVVNVRLATLRATGHYSEHFQNRETEPEMIREMLIQGIETNHYEGLNNPVVQQIVRDVKKYEDTILSINNLDSSVTRGVIYSFEEVLYNERHGGENILSAIEYLKINLENGQLSFVEKRDVDIQLEEDSKEVLEQAIHFFVKLASENKKTRFGMAIGASEDMAIVFIEDDDGLISEHRTMDVVPILLEDYELEVQSLKGAFTQKGFLKAH